MADPASTLVHLTLNTGDRRDSPRGEVANRVIRLLRPLVQEGGGPIPGMPRYRFTLTRARGDAVFTIWDGERVPVLHGALATEDSAATWRLLCAVTTGLPIEVRAAAPPRLPWLGVLLLPPAAQVPRADLGALADFERCLAWTVIEAPPHPEPR